MCPQVVLIWVTYRWNVIVVELDASKIAHRVVAQFVVNVYSVQVQVMMESVLNAQLLQMETQSPHTE